MQTLDPFETTGVVDLWGVQLNERYVGPFPGVVNYTFAVSIGIPMLNPPNPVLGESSRYSVTVVQPVMPVPEPSTLLLGAAGLLVAAAARRRSAKRG